MSGEKTSRKLQKIATKEKILGVAADLFVNKGIMSVSTSEIAKKAGVSKGTVFHHFTNKEDLVLSVLRLFLGGEMAEIIKLVESDQSSIDTLEMMIYQTLKYSVEKPSFTAFMINVFVEFSHISDDTEKSELYEIIEGFFRPLMEHLAKALERIGISGTENKSRILVGLLDGLGFQLFLDRKILSDAEIIAIKDEIMDIINFWRSK